MKNLRQLITELRNGDYDDRLSDIYVDENMTEYQKDRYAEALERYETLFGGGEVELYSAPGRSEVCGNHTDHQRGMVIATSVNLDTVAVAGYNDENVVRLKSEGYDMITVDLSQISVNKEEEGNSISLVKGIINGLTEKGYKIGGFNSYITSNVIAGAGLSSSASFEVVICAIISGMFNDMTIDSALIARVSQYAENVYFNKPCGLMDQMACSVGGLINIDFKEPEAPIVNRINVDFDGHGYSLCIVDTKGSHADLTEDYAKIPVEMEKVAIFMDKKFLREVDEGEFYSNIEKLRKSVGDRAVLRAIHFFEEERNVLNAVKYLNDGNFDSFLGVIKKSGDSSFKYLQNVYTNQDVQHQNLSVALALSESVLKDKGVCRVHGGGFAGTIQAFVKNEFVEEYKDKIEAVFGEGSCYVLKVRQYGGIKVV